MRKNVSGKSKKPKSSFKSFAITSLAIGIFTIVTMLVITSIEDFSSYPFYITFWFVGRDFQFPALLYLSLLLVSFVGFLLGIVGLWSKRKIMTIIGIILCAWGVYWIITKPLYF